MEGVSLKEFKSIIENKSMNEVQIKVWALISYKHRFKEDITKALKIYNISINEYEKYKNTFPIKVSPNT